MTLLKLTEDIYTDPDKAGKVIYDVLYGKVHFELLYKDKQWGTTELYGEEATEAWTNWRAYIEGRTDAKVQSVLSEDRNRQ